MGHFHVRTAFQRKGNIDSGKPHMMDGPHPPQIIALLQGGMTGGPLGSWREITGHFSWE